MFNRRDILIVEDNPADVRLMQEALRPLQPPVEIHVVTDGDEALQFLRREGAYSNVPSPGLIFLDFNLPKSDSREILRQIKLDTRLRLIPIAVLTTSSSERDVSEAYQLHANCYLNKAADLDGFFRIIRSAAHFWLDIASIPPRPLRLNHPSKMGLAGNPSHAIFTSLHPPTTAAQFHSCARTLSIAPYARSHEQ